MNTTALKNTIFKLAVCTVAALAVNLIIYSVPIQYICTGLLIVGLGIAVKGIYESERDRAERLEQLNSIK